MRLQKYLSQSGVASRRNSEQLIKDGRVKVNGETVTAMGVIISPETDRVEVDNRPIKTVIRHEYFLLYKPVGYVTTLKDQFGRPTIRDLLADVKVRVYPVGRLDMDTSGVLLLTNNGEMANRLTHPSFGVEKEYLARVRDLPDAQALATLAKGVNLLDGMTAPATVRLVKGGRPTSVVSLTIKEGRNRQVRRMFEAVGHPVVSLKRVRFGPLTLSDMQAGSWRNLTSKEVAQLKKHVQR
ncbi:MAG: rRNA pseudouridine synthase [Dethiobacter sp.]|jgi:23S rRNA pseudouridine2605 synthase|nr:rRNA pseudouridine synthase [Dethiobacter sp.]MBS3900538.1 rRNA pseudouridine synthase [Dethiobacter sp.]MBS3989356.1 rRNA pseudouridine synthase [Dethiobacter sp.]MBS3989498.1 rRNA pseudouridine synthase [Dethiobacter sp.]